MSRHYLVMSQQVFGVNVAAAETLIKKLEATDPESAARLRKVNWSKLRRKLMQQAIKDVAREQGYTVSGEYDNTVGSYGSESGEPPTGGEVLGVLGNGDVQLGVAVKKDGSFHLFQNGYSKERSHSMQAAVQKRYRELSVEAVLTVLRCSVKKKRQGDETVFVAKLPKKGRVR